jgi:hypothetical protein
MHRRMSFVSHIHTVREVKQMNKKIDFIRYSAGFITSFNLLLNSLGYNIIGNTQIVNLTNVISFAYLMWLTHKSCNEEKQTTEKSKEKE